MALRTWTLPVLPKATLEDVNDPTLGWSAQTTAGPNHLYAYVPFKANARVDSVGTTNTSATVTDTAIQNIDFGRPVSGPGIPANSYVGTVTPGVSFLLSSTTPVQTNANATATASVSATIQVPVYGPWIAAAAIPSTIAAPSVGTATTGGTLAAATYSYAYTYQTVFGESVLSAVATQTTTGSTSTVTVTPAALPAWATGVNFYGRVGGSLVLLFSQTTAAAWTDTGSISVAGLHANSGRNEALAAVKH